MPPKGWPDIRLDEAAVKRLARTSGNTLALLLLSNLFAFDIDVTDPGLVEQMLDAVERIMPGITAGGILRGNTRNAKLCLFARIATPFGRLATRHYKPAPDAKGQMVEAYGGGFAKYFNLLGLHDATDPKSWYQPLTGDLVEIGLEDAPAIDAWLKPLAELPVYTEAQVNEALTACTELFIAAGWTTQERLDPRQTPARLYDLDDTTVFRSAEIDGTMTLDELRTMVKALDGVDDGLPLFATFMPGRGEDENPKRCHARFGGRFGDVYIVEWQGPTHYPVEHEPDTEEADTAAIAEALDALVVDERSPVDESLLRGPRRFESALKHLQTEWCLMKTKGNGVCVSIPPETGNQEVTIPAMRNDMQSCDYETDEGKHSVVSYWLVGGPKKVVGIRMRPDLPQRIYEEAGMRWLNSFALPRHDAEGGETDTWRAFMVHLVPDPDERAWFLQWLAHKVQHPAAVGPGVVMVARNFGTGRGTLVKIMTAVLGERYVQPLPFDHLTGRNAQSRFNGALASALLVAIDEAATPDEDAASYSSRRQAYEMIKQAIEPGDGSRKRFEDKGVKAFNGRSWANYLVATNHPDAIKMPAGDRRMTVISNDEIMSQAMAAALERWRRDPANIAALFRELRAWPITSYIPSAIPPLFSGKAEMIELGMVGEERVFAEVLDAMPGEIFTPYQVVEHMRPKAFELKQNWADRAMMRVRSLFPVGDKDLKPMINGRRSRAYARQSEEAKAWSRRQHRVITAELLKNEKGGGEAIGGKLASPEAVVIPLKPRGNV